MSLKRFLPVEGSFYEEKGKYRGIVAWMMSTDHKRIGLMYLGGPPLLFFRGSAARHAHAAQYHLSGLDHEVSDLQRSLYGPWPHPDLPLHHPRRAGGFRKFLPPHLDRRQGRRLPEDQPIVLVALCNRCRHHPHLPLYPREATGYRLDILCPLQHQDPGQHQHGRLRRLCPGVFLHPHRSQLRRHHPPPAGARDGLVPHAGFRLDPLRHGLGPDAGDASPRHYAPLHHSRQSLRSGLFRPCQGRGPHPFRAPLLDLFPSGRLHHAPARHGDHQRSHPRFLQAQALRLRRRVPCPPWESPSSATPSGGITCSRAE